MLKRGHLFIVSCFIIILLFLSNQVSAGKIQKRFRGSEKYTKDINTSRNGCDKLNCAVLVSDEDLGYALSVVPLAKEFNAPIILTNTKVLEDDAKDELIRLNIKKVFVVGVPGIISGDMESQLYKYNIDCQRILRKNRYGNSLKVAQFIVRNNSMVTISEKKPSDELSTGKGMFKLLLDKQELSYDALKSTERNQTNIKTVNEFSNNIEFRSIYVTIGGSFSDRLSDSTFTEKRNYSGEFTNSHVLLLKTPFGSKISFINDLTTPYEEVGVSDATTKTLLSDKEMDEDKSYDAEKVSKILEKNYENDGKKIAFLTFDDGPSTTVTPKILDILKSNNIKATFFLIGSSVQSDEESKNLVKRILQDGHAIGNHTYSHNLKIIYPGNKVDSEKYMEEVKETNDAISNSIGREFKARIIRMPGGYMSRKYYNDPNLNTFNTVLRENNMYSIDWNAYDGDSDGRRKSAEELLKEVKNTVGNQEKVVLLMHDTYGKEETARALPKIIEYLRNQGYEFRKIK